MTFGQTADNLLAILGIGEDGPEEPVKFIFQTWLAAKENHIRILFEAIAFTEITQIIGYPSEYHVRLYDVIARQFNVFVLSSRVVPTILSLVFCR